MRVTIKDEAADVVAPHVTPSRTVDDLVEAAVWRVGHVSPSHRCIILGEEEINRLEKRLGCPVLSDAASLWKAIDKLADIKLHKISFEFSPAQLAELEARAAREDQSVEEYARRIVHAMIPQFFNTAPAQAQQPAMARR